MGVLKETSVCLSVILQLGTLPAADRDLSSSSSCFCSHLKTELFSRVYGVNLL